MKTSLLKKILLAQDAKISLAVVTRLEDGAQLVVEHDVAKGDFTLSSVELSEVMVCIRDDKSRLISEERYFVHAYNPKLRLIIVGAVHIAQALAPMASLSGFEVIVVDPRGSFANSARFPGMTLLDDWPDEALVNLTPDTRTAVVTLTHDPKLDDPALEKALRSPAFYIASLGSRRTHGKRLERMKNKGFDDATLDRIHGPAGFNIGAVSPSEIAISILAELTSVLHGRTEKK